MPAARFLARTGLAYYRDAHQAYGAAQLSGDRWLPVPSNKGGTMALIKCSECGNDVSSNAATCPRCGNPIAQASEAKAVGTQITTTQATAKKFKGQQLIATVLCIAGVITIIGGEAAGTKTIGSLIFLLGIILFIVARVRSWWHHG